MSDTPELEANEGLLVPGQDRLVVEHDVGKGWELIYGQESGYVVAQDIVAALSRFLETVGIRGSVRITYQKLTDPRIEPQAFVRDESGGLHRV